MRKAGPSEVLGGLAVASVAIAPLLVCCGGPLLAAAIVALVASAGLIAAGAVLVGVLALGLAVALGLRYARQRSAIRRGERECAECASDPAARHDDRPHAVPPPA